ncbi:MAG: rod shape-determining protein MreC [Eubacteriaceae bacterium]|nr:rod shape-determining protein MreC [Eubacteriaceae bacterium]
MKWLSEHKLFTVITGIVVVLCLVIVISFLTAGGSTGAGRGFQAGMAAVQKPIASFTAAVKENVSGIFSYKKLQKENKELRAKNESLEKENQDLKLKKDELNQLKKLSKSFDFAPFSGTGKAKAGHIIELDNSNPYVVFTIDIGSDDGIKKNNIVVDGSGLVGRVQEVGKGYSKVVSVLSSSNSISFKVLRKTSLTGVLKGNGNGKLSGYMMKDNAAVLKGDVLITSGVGIYPEGIKIGTVSSVDYDEDSQLKVVKVKPTVDFDGLQKVAVYYEY